jgi:hypothetical protein
MVKLFERKQTTRSAFEELVAEAVTAYLARQALEQPGQGRLSAEGFRRMAVALTTVERVDRARALLANAARFPATLQFLDRCVRAIGAGGMRSIPREVEGKAFFRDEASASELAAEGLRLRDVLVLAVERAAARYPGAFGTVEDFDVIVARRRELDEQLAGFYATIDAFPKGPGEIVWEEAPEALRREGYVKAWFALAPGQV